MFHACAVILVLCSCACAVRLPFSDAVVVNMLESWNIVTENVTVISCVSTLPMTFAAGTSGLVLMASAGVLCVFLCLCVGSGSGRAAPAQQTHSCEAGTQQGTLNRECCLDDFLSSSDADGSEAPGSHRLDRCDET